MDINPRLDRSYMEISPLAKKLRIKPGHKILLVNAPEKFIATIEHPDIFISYELEITEFDVIIGFYKQQSALDKDTSSLNAAMGDKGILWVCYPKGTSKVPTDLNRDILYENLLAKGLKGVAMVAIDDTWSALRVKKV